MPLRPVEGGGFEPPKAEPSDLQSDPFGRSGTPPKNGSREFCGTSRMLSTKVVDFLAIQRFCPDPNRRALAHRAGYLMGYTLVPSRQNRAEATVSAYLG